VAAAGAVGGAVAGAAVAEEVEVEAAAEAAAERGQALRARARRRSRVDEASTPPRCSAVRQAWPGVGLGEAGVARGRVRGGRRGLG